MSIASSTETPDGTTVDTDICIVGGGPTGISLALRLADGPLRVLLLESGDLAESEAAQALNAGSVVGTPYYALDATRFRGLGGSSGRWAGWCRPLDALDMEKRDWVPRSGWPLDRKELDPYYAESATICQLESTDFAGLRVTGLPTLYEPPFVGGDVGLAIWHGSPPTKFGVVYRDRLAAASNVRVFTDATATAVTLDRDRRRATGVSVASRAGHRFSVTARAVVVCAGAIETARLLLASDPDGAGIGNEHGLVGRHFMEHPHLVTGRIALDDGSDRERIAAIDEGLRGIGARVALQRPTGSMKLAYTVVDERKRAEGLLNFSTHLRTISPVTSEDSEAYQAFKLMVVNARSPKRLIRQIKEGTLPAGIGTLAARVLRGLPEITRAVYHEALKKPKQLALYTQAEQSPNPESRVTLDRDRLDRFGMPTARLDWQLSRIDKESIIRSQEIVAKRLEDAGLGTLVPEEPFRDLSPGWGPGLKGGHHHLGTARMSDDPASGVVDRDGKVHTVGDLYVGDSSVFPTGGFANPMFTAVALSLRLGDHLAATYR